MHCILKSAPIVNAALFDDVRAIEYATAARALRAVWPPWTALMFLPNSIGFFRNLVMALVGPRPELFDGYPTADGDYVYGVGAFIPTSMSRPNGKGN